MMQSTVVLVGGLVPKAQNGEYRASQYTLLHYTNVRNSSGGNCVCPIDKCGNTCLSLRNNPNNCGSCGKICSSGYCVQGQCYTPPAACTAGFENGDFDKSKSLDGWTFNAWADNVSDGPYAGRRSYGIERTAYGTEGVILLLKLDPVYVNEFYAIVPQRQGTQFLEFFTEVPMCPGKRYSFDFIVGNDERFGAQGACSFSMSFGGQKVYDNQQVTHHFGSIKPVYYAAPLHASELDTNGARTVGPFDSNSGGGVQKNGPGLTVPFKARMVCDGSGGEGTPYAKIEFGDFKITELS